MKILLVGGGSGGPVAPLLAIANKIKEQHPQAKFLLVGGKQGPERHMAEMAGIDFTRVTAGKLRRYFSWQNFLAPVLVAVGFFQSLKILKMFSADCVFATGSFVQVPVVWAAWLKGVPIVLHQQDAEAGLANRLCQLFAKKITVTFPASIAVWTSSAVYLEVTAFKTSVAAGSMIRS